MNALIKMVDDEEVKDLRRQFEEIDKDGSGLIMASDLSEIIKKCNMEMTREEIEKMTNEVDYHGNGKISYSEFLSATMDIKHILSEQKLNAVFS